jgi:hypothetical protein
MMTYDMLCRNRDDEEIIELDALLHFPDAVAKKEAKRAESVVGLGVEIG